jgi:hypothetical protein
MKNNLATPSKTPTDQEDGADSKGAEVDAAEAWETQLAKVQGIGKLLCILFGIGLGIAGLVVLGVLINTFVLT